MFGWLSRFFGQNLAMDLGTANSLIYTPQQGVVLNEPSVVAFDTRSGRVLAVGTNAKRFIGRTPEGIKTVRPLKDGVIADFEVTKAMIAYFLRKALIGMRLVKPRIIICVPTGITQVEKRAVVESAEDVGAGLVRLIEEPMAAAIGANLPVHDPVGTMALDIGGGTSEVAIISLSAIAYSESVRIAGDEMNEAVQRYCQERFHILIGENQAEQVKIQLGSAWPLAEPCYLEISGKSTLDGRPQSITITDTQVREALAEPVRTIIDTVRRALEKTPPELISDIGRNGLLMAGGGSLLRGLDRLITVKLGLAVTVDEDPLTTVVRGTGYTLRDPQLHEKVYIN